MSNFRDEWRGDIQSALHHAQFWATVTALPGAGTVSVLFPGASTPVTIPTANTYVAPAVNDVTLVLKTGVNWVAMGITGTQQFWAAVTATPGGGTVTVKFPGATQAVTIPKLSGYTPAVNDNALVLLTNTGFVAVGVVG